MRFWGFFGFFHIIVIGFFFVTDNCKSNKKWDTWVLKCNLFIYVTLIWRLFCPLITHSSRLWGFVMWMTSLNPIERGTTRWKCIKLGANWLWWGANCGWALIFGHIIRLITLHLFRRVIIREPIPDKIQYSWITYALTTVGHSSSVRQWYSKCIGLDQKTE